MLILGIVFALLFAAFSIITYIIEETKITNTLKENMEKSKDIFFEDSIDTLSPEDKIYNVSFTVFVDENGTVLNQTENNTQEDTLKALIEYAMNSESERGNHDEKEISFMRKSTDGGYLISFLSREHLKERLTENLSLGALASFIFLLVFWAISIRFASIALAPVEKAWEQQKQFLADASHDLKTPLTVILANNNIIASHKDQTVESQMKWIESTTEEAGRMSDLVNKMLELAKSEAARDELRIGEVDLSELVENSILQFEVVAFEKNLEIESGIQPKIFARTHDPTF